MGIGDHGLLLETRSRTIERHTLRLFHETRAGWMSHSERVMEIYHQRVPEHAREIIFSAEADPFKRAKSNGKLIKRFMDPDATVRMPVDIEESWVLALPEPFQTSCRRDLAARYGLLDVPLPSLSGINPARCLSDVTQAFGSFLSTMSVVMADNQVTAEDRPHIEAAKVQVRALIAAAEGQLALLDKQSEAISAGGYP